MVLVEPTFSEDRAARWDFRRSCARAAAVPEQTGGVDGRQSAVTNDRRIVQQYWDDLASSDAPAFQSAAPVVGIRMTGGISQCTPPGAVQLESMSE